MRALLVVVLGLALGASCSPTDFQVCMQTCGARGVREYRSPFATACEAPHPAACVCGASPPDAAPR